MTLTVTHQEIEHDEHGHVAGVRLAGDEILVTWNCGDTLHFSLDRAEQTLDNVRLTAEASPGVWFKDSDAHGYNFAVLIRDGDLYASTSPADNVDELAHVPWAELRRAVNRVLRQARKREPVAA